MVTPEVSEIFKTLDDTGKAKDFDKAVDALTEYFEPVKNRIYQTYLFRQDTQGQEETIDQFHTRLRRLVEHCEFYDTDFEIIMHADSIPRDLNQTEKKCFAISFCLHGILLSGMDQI